MQAVLTKLSRFLASLNSIVEQWADTQRLHAILVHAFEKFMFTTATSGLACARNDLNMRVQLPDLGLNELEENCIPLILCSGPLAWRILHVMPRLFSTLLAISTAWAMQFAFVT
jgi:hypothetical protein